MKLFLSSRWLPAVGIILALLLLAAAVSYPRQSLRTELRAQLARRDAVLVSSVLKQHLRSLGSETLEDPLVALLDTAEIPELAGVLSIGLYDTNGLFFGALTLLASDTDLTVDQIAMARDGGLTSRYGPASEVDAESLGSLPGQRFAGTAPVLEVILPIPSINGFPEGYARFLLDAEGLSNEYAALDDTLRKQSRLAFLLAGAAMTVALAFVFRRLSETQRHLIIANRELTLAAKTAAVGAVTSHLIHGLKNPLAGLHQFVSAGAVAPNQDSAAEWSEVAGATRRMQGMIEAVTGILREESGLVRYEISPRELLDQLIQRESGFAREAGVELSVSVRSDRPLMNRVANIALLILENLVRNAVQAAPAGGCVRLSADESPQAVEFRVCDNGTGIPDAVRRRIFTPVVTTKEGGTGLGLALSQQLARSLGADLELIGTGPGGTEFLLRLPKPLAGGAVPAVSQALGG